METMTRKFGGKRITLTLDRVDPRNGNQLWRGHNGRNYILVASSGRMVRAELTVA